MRKSTASPPPVPTSAVKFEISPEAAAVARRGGHLWIWPHGRSARATAEPPAEERKWKAYRQAGFVVHVDDAIVPPERWVVALPKKAGRHLDARWNGAGRPPLTDSRSLYERVSSRVGLPGVLLLLLAIVGLTRLAFAELWFDATPFVALLAVAVIWIRRRVRRVDASAP